MEGTVRCVDGGGVDRPARSSVSSGFALTSARIPPLRASWRSRGDIPGWVCTRRAPGDYRMLVDIGLLSPTRGICKEIADKFRNGGVHEKIIPYNVCKEAFHKILEMPDNYLSRLIAVSPSAR